MTRRKFVLQSKVGPDVHIELDEAVEANLRSLMAHPGWKLYSALLLKQRASVFEGLMVASHDEYAKRIGVAEGLSLAVNQIAHMVQNYEQKEHAKHVAAESTKQSQPKGSTGSRRRDMSGTPGVPDHRLDEMMQRMRELTDQNNKLRGTVEAIMQQRQQAAPVEPPEESPFQPEVERALQLKMDREFNKRMQPLQEQTRQSFGALADQNDYLRFSLQYGADTYDKAKDKIERVREERSRSGQWVSREDAYRLIYFDEHGKKPAVAPASVPKADAIPAIDPYTGMYKEPLVSAEALASQAAPVAPAPAAPSLQAQPQESQVPALPPQSVTPIMSQGQAATPVPRNLDVAMGAAELDSWATKYGDIPL